MMVVLLFTIKIFAYLEFTATVNFVVFLTRQKETMKSYEKWDFTKCPLGTLKF